MPPCGFSVLLGGVSCLQFLPCLVCVSLSWRKACGSGCRCAVRGCRCRASSLCSPSGPFRRPGHARLRGRCRCRQRAAALSCVAPGPPGRCRFLSGRLGLRPLLPLWKQEVTRPLRFSAWTGHRLRNIIRMRFGRLPTGPMLPGSDARLPSLKDLPGNVDRPDPAVSLCGLGRPRLVCPDRSNSSHPRETTRRADWSFRLELPWKRQSSSQLRSSLHPRCSSTPTSSPPHGFSI